MFNVDHISQFRAATVICYTHVIIYSWEYPPHYAVNTSIACNRCNSGLPVTWHLTRWLAGVRLFPLFPNLVSRAPSLVRCTWDRLRYRRWCKWSPYAHHICCSYIIWIFSLSDILKYLRCMQWCCPNSKVIAHAEMPFLLVSIYSPEHRHSPIHTRSGKKLEYPPTCPFHWSMLHALLPHFITARHALEHSTLVLCIHWFLVA